MDTFYKIFKPLVPFGLLGLLGLSVCAFPDIYLCLLCGILISYFLHWMVKIVYWVLSKLIPFNSFSYALWNISILISIAIYVLLSFLVFWIIAPGITLQYKNFVNVIANEATYTQIADAIQVFLNQPFITDIKDYVQPNLSAINHEMFSKFGVIAKDFINKIVSISSSIIYSAHNLINFSISFVIAFHIVREWDEWGKRLKKLETVEILAPYSERIEMFVEFCGSKMQSWIQSQIVIASIMCVYYSVCFALLGLSTPILLGFIFGCSSFVPYLSDLISFATLIVSLISSGSDLLVCILSFLAVFVGHFVSGYIIGPLLIGKTTKLNVVQVLIGFILHIKLFGIVGIMLNIPFCVITNGLLKMIFYKPAKITKKNAS